MDWMQDWMQVVSRWLHVVPVVLLVGGAAFLRFVLHPASSVLPESERDALRQRVSAIWKKLVHPLVGLIVVSGAYNFYRRMGAVSPWHMVAGIKVLLGLWVLFVASVLSGSSPKFQRFRDHWPYWLGLNVALAVVVILLSGYLRFLPLKGS